MSLPAASRTSVWRPSGGPLSPKTAYYLRHLLAGHFRLVPSTVEVPEPTSRAITFHKPHLLTLTDSPRFLAALDAVPDSVLEGWLVFPDQRQPTLLLKNAGAWTFRLPQNGRDFQELPDLKSPADLVPESFQWYGRKRILHHRHLIQLRGVPRARLTIDLTIYPSGQVAYQASVFLSQTRQIIPLMWEEAERVINLFRDLAASYFRGVTPPATDPGRRPSDGAPPVASSSARAADAKPTPTGAA